VEEVGFGSSWAPTANPEDKLGKAETEGDDSASSAAAEEVEVVGGSGEGHDYVLPHLRFSCTVHPFKAKAASNEHCCAACYCYICDVEASKCHSWAGKHCHATDQNPADAAIRASAKKSVTWFQAAVKWCQDCGLLDEAGALVGAKGWGSSSDISVPRFLNRLLGLPVAQQNSLFEYFMSVLEVTVRTAKNEGKYDEGITLLKGQSIKFDQDSPRVIEATSALADIESSKLMYYRMTQDRGVSFEAAKEICDEALEAEKTAVVATGDQRRIARQKITGFWVSRNKIFGQYNLLLAVKTTTASAFVSAKTRIWRPGVGRLEMITTKLFDIYEMVPEERMAPLWDAEYASRKTKCMHLNCKIADCVIGKRILPYHVLAGSVVPVWGSIENIVNKNRGQKARFDIVRAVEKSIESSPAGAAAESSSSSSSSSSITGGSVAAPRQCVGIKIDAKYIDAVLEGLQSGIC